MLAAIKKIRRTDASSVTTDWVVLAASVLLLTFTVTTNASLGSLFAAADIQSAASATAHISAPY